MKPLTTDAIAIDATQQELDEIYLYLAYAIVYKDWQDDDVPREKRRGYNIGCILTDKDQHIVHHGLNAINSTNNSTQHGEVRAITQYLEREKGYNLKGCSLYSTLEPCVMCAGMMTMTAVERLVFGQRDVDYSHAFERLAIDTRPIGGFAPYPRQVKVWQSKDAISKELDVKYKAFLATEEEKILAKFLATDEVKAIYQNASQRFLNYTPKNPENVKYYQEALKYYQEI